MVTKSDLAKLIFKDVQKTVEDLEKMFPKRELDVSAKVTRFAPSPTGFLHTGSLFTAMIAHKLAKDSNGVFYIRLEDTDTKREVVGSGELLLNQLKQFHIVPNEGYLGENETGNYGPYKQSEREWIYRVVIKHLIEIGRAYPCFCSSGDLEQLRARQESEKLIPGYYQEYAKCRNMSLEDAYARIENNEPYVIRFKSMGNHENKIEIKDEIRGNLELSENDQDIVILKSDGLPTYHFAHVVDDHFMRTNFVTRGEEWLPSLPIHLEIFDSLGYERPHYAHLPVILKLDNGNRRKLSKRKDDEAAVSYFLEDGYPQDALLEYLMTIANSNYEEWRIQNPLLDKDEFKLSFEKMSLDGALFDLGKLKYISKELLSKMTKSEIAENARNYAIHYNNKLLKLIDDDRDYFESIMNIEREKENPRKDYEKYSDILGSISFFYEEYYFKLAESIAFNPLIENQVIIAVLKDLKVSLDLSQDEQSWFANLKLIGQRNGFAESFKIYKNDKENYLGHVGDIAEMLRIAMTTSKQSPNLFCVLQILGYKKIQKRIDFVIAKLLN